MFEFQSVRRSFPRNLGQTTSYKTEVQEREPWVFYEWITCNEKPRKTQMRSEYFSRNVLAGNINRWKNITADGLFRKNGTTTIWIWKHWNNMILNFSVTHGITGNVIGWRLVTNSRFRCGIILGNHKFGFR
jgi:hypothetical protein